MLNRRGRRHHPGPRRRRAPHRRHAAQEHPRRLQGENRSPQATVTWVVGISDRSSPAAEVVDGEFVGEAPDLCELGRPRAGQGDPGGRTRSSRHAIVSKLELRDLLRAITASVRNMMQRRADGSDSPPPFTRQEPRFHPPAITSGGSNALRCRFPPLARFPACYRGKPGFLPNAGPRRRVRLTCPVADP